MMEGRRDVEPTSYISEAARRCILNLSEASLRRTKSDLLNIGKTSVITVPREPVSSETVAEDSDEEYDTDLEEIEKFETPADNIGRRVYTRTCRKLGVLPVPAIERGMAGREISVCNRGMRPFDTLALCNGLLENSRLTTLLLESNMMGPVDAEYLASLLCSNFAIKTLSLRSNVIRGEGARAIAQMLLVNTALTSLDVSGNRIENEAGKDFAEVMKKNSVLRTLSLSENHFGDGAAALLGPAIAHNKSLHSLDLSWNEIRPEGALRLCQGIKVNESLTTFHVAMNGFSTLGAAALASILVTNTSLTDVDVSCNRIFDQGASQISKALAKNETLRYFRISKNPMTTESAMLLLLAIKENPATRLELLDMESVHIYRDSLNMVEEIKRSHPRFRFKYGGVVNSGNHMTPREGNPMAHKNPLTLLLEYVSTAGLRLHDLFKQFDKDASQSVSKEEFIRGLQSIGAPLTVKQLDLLMDMLDKDGDGEVDFGELVAGEKQHRLARRRRRTTQHRREPPDLGLGTTSAFQKTSITEQPHI